MAGALSWVISLFIIILDQASKAYISRNLFLGQSIPVIKNVFHISLVHNTGVAFGLFKGYGIFFVVLSFSIAAYIARYAIVNRHKDSFRKRMALSLILGGACGNLIDRLRFGHIVDFFDLRVWPVFNIADSAITIGMLFLIIELYCKHNPRRKGLTGLSHKT